MNDRSSTRLIAAEQARRRIPDRALQNFDALTNKELYSMRDDENLAGGPRAWAGWEADYRDAVGMVVYYDDDQDRIIRADIRDDDAFERLKLHEARPRPLFDGTSVIDRVIQAKRAAKAIAPA